MKIGIVDTYSLSKKGEIYGHYSKTAKQYSKVLDKNNEIYIIGGKGYEKIVDSEKYICLPFSVDLDSNYSSVIGKIIKYSGCFINALLSFFSDCDTLVFQDSNRNLVSFVLAILPIKKRVFFIRYSEDYGKRKYYQKLAYKKLTGVITSLESVANSFNCKAVIIPDYLPDLTSKKDDITKEYDVAVVGTVTDEKDYEMVARVFSNTTYRVIIAGNFRDKRRLNELRKMSSSNISIIDSYLKTDAYERIIYCSKYVMLPYFESKIPKSSGVVLDALYRHVPVIVPDNIAFSFIKEKNLGITYHNQLEITNLLANYNEYRLNTDTFVEEMRSKKSIFYDFVCL